MLHLHDPTLASFLMTVSLTTVQLQYCWVCTRMRCKDSVYFCFCLAGSPAPMAVGLRDGL